MTTLKGVHEFLQTSFECKDQVGTHDAAKEFHDMAALVAAAQFLRETAADYCDRYGEAGLADLREALRVLDVLEREGE